MAVMKKKGSSGTPPISTASLPDIIFMLLFFFMTSTTMREVELKVKTKLPVGTEVQKLENKSLISYIYIGSPTKTLQKQYGDRPRIQLNNDYKTKTEILEYVVAEREKLSEADKPLMTISLKVDNNVRMGIITEVKQELRKANALKLCYVAGKATLKDFYEQ
ncbi:MAG: biopolymer transporter ExbD [Bacteroidetes bacterium]|nr:biopolymer transporter ExbD [Bacteroidota bacterium]